MRCLQYRIDLLFHVRCRRNALVVVLGENAHFQISGIAGVQAGIFADPQAERGRDHHQHTGGEDTNGSQTGTVPLHTVGHGGNGNEVVQFIVVLFVFLEQLAQCHRAADEQQVRSDNDQHNGNKQHQQSLYGIFCGQCQIIRGAQQ